MTKRRILFIFVPVLGLTVLGALTAGAALRRGGLPFHPGCPHGGADQHRERVAFVVDHMLGEIDASDEQRESIDAILESAFERADEAREGKEEHRAQLRAALTADTVDREALEALRVEALEHMEEASVALMDVLIETGEVLTPEQREQLATMVEEHHMK